MDKNPEQSHNPNKGKNWKRRTLAGAATTAILAATPAASNPESITTPEERQEHHNIKTLHEANERITPQELYDVELTAAGAEGSGDKVFINRIPEDPSTNTGLIQREGDPFVHSPSLHMSLAENKGERLNELWEALPTPQGETALGWQEHHMTAQVTDPEGETFPALIYEEDYPFTSTTVRPSPSGKNLSVERSLSGEEENIVVPIIGGENTAGVYELTLEQHINTGLIGANADQEQYFDDLENNTHTNEIATVSVQVETDGSAVLLK